MDESTALPADDQSPLQVLFQFIFVVPAERSFARRYGIALAGTLLAFALRDIVGENLIYTFPFGFFVPVVLLSASFGSFGAGVAAMVGGALLGIFFFLEPHNEWGPLTTYGAYALFIYLLTSSIGVGLITLERSQKWKLAQEVEDLRAQLIEALT